MPFSKIAWNSNASKNDWSNLFSQINALTFKAEYEMTKRRLRKANVYHMSPANFDKQIEQITKDGLVFLPILRSKVYNGFSHSFYPVDKLEPDTFVYGVVADSLDNAEKFCQATKDSDHKTIGNLLGYPECCCETFQDNWINKKIADPCYEAAVNTKDAILDKETVYVKGHPHLNTMLRYFGLKIIPFFPCSYKCSNAVEVSKLWLEVMESIDSEATLQLKYLLDQPLTWSLSNSIIYIKTPLMRAVVNGYTCNTRKDIIWK
jgi:Uncharacterized protein conserved in archaea